MAIKRQTGVRFPIQKELPSTWLLYIDHEKSIQKRSLLAVYLSNLSVVKVDLLSASWLTKVRQEKPQCQIDAIPFSTPFLLLPPSLPDRMA